MKFVKYKKYVPEPASELSMEDLLAALSDHLLQSGFQRQYRIITTRTPPINRSKIFVMPLLKL